MQKFVMLIFLTLWLSWLSGPALTGPLALRYINKPAFHHIATAIVTVFVAYRNWLEDVLRSIMKLGETLTRGP